MTKNRVWFSAILLAALATGSAAHLHMNDGSPSDSVGLPKLVNTCVITNDVNRLVEFYEPILRLKAKRPTQDYAEFCTAGGAVLAIFSVKAQEKYIPGSAEAAMNKSLILEFRVPDVDQEYRRLQALVKTWVKPPTTQPWGTRSIYFRDPDGNLVDFYSQSKVQ